MKTYLKVLGIIVLSMIIGFSMTACSDDGGGGGLSVTGGGESNVTITANQLTLKGKVFTTKETMTGISYVAYTGDHTLGSIGGGSGSITNGTLSYTVASAPTELEDLDQEFLNYFFEGWSNLTAVETDAKYIIIGSTQSYLKSDDNDYGLYIGKVTLSGNMFNYTYTEEAIAFIYVDKAVTISGKGKEKGNVTINDVHPRTEDFEIALTTGWNAICLKFVEIPSTSYITSISKMTSIPNTFTWVIREVD